MDWYIFALLSAILSGLVPIIDKKILKKVEVIDFSTIYALTNLILSLGLLFIIPFNFDWKITVLIFIGSIFGSLGFYTINKALKKYDVSLVSPLRSFNPIILLLLAAIFLGEILSFYNIIGILLIIIGTYIIESRNILHKPFEPLKHMLKSSLTVLVLMSGTFYGISSIIDKVILSKYDIFSYIILAHLFIAINFSILNAVENKRLFAWNKKIKSVMGLILIASIATVSYRLLLAKAVSLALISLVIPIKHLDSLISTLIGGELFHEKHLMKKMIAASIMFVGTLLVILL